MLFEDLEKVITPEQLKHLCSFVIEQDPSEEIDRIAIRILGYLFVMENPEITDEEIVNKVNQVYIDGIVSSLEEKGLVQSYIDEEGEFSFDLTEKGMALDSEGE